MDGGGDEAVECFKYVVLEDGKMPVNIVDYEPIIDSVQLSGKETTKMIKSEKELETEVARLQVSLKDDQSNDWKQRVADL